MISIEILQPSRAFRNSLDKYHESVLSGLGIPKGLVRQLGKTGLPLHSQYFVFEENPIHFYPSPQFRRYALIPGDYLEIAAMEWVGKIAVEIGNGLVWQVFEREFRVSFMNSSLSQYIECLGVWLQFYPQFQEYVRDMLAADSQFSLYENPEVYDPVREKLKEIDPMAMQGENNYWARCCEPDIV